MKQAHTTVCKRTAACERKEPWGPGAGEGWHGAASASRSSAQGTGAGSPSAVSFRAVTERLLLAVLLPSGLPESLVS